MKMPIKIVYYERKSSTDYLGIVFQTYDDFGRWYLKERLNIGIISIKEISEEIIKYSK